MSEHPFETAIKGLTGLPPMHNFYGDYYTGMENAQKLMENKNRTVCYVNDPIDVLHTLSTYTSNWCLCGHSVYFENKNDALKFKMEI